MLLSRGDCRDCDVVGFPRRSGLSSVPLRAGFCFFFCGELRLPAPSDSIVILVRLPASTVPMFLCGTSSASLSV